MKCWLTIAIFVNAEKVQQSDSFAVTNCLAVSTRKSESVALR